ncbi:hypothetical protein DYB26_002199 [Aphanomyces astaci]|uniref:START domain-containing protein n=1 Tax=Aphanomyces astaci TaxID=112090 RepID=A0A397DAH5_APHAT|nr:hypothetical protein DYB38_001508 [Aphanomyces astaci]RHZ21162.1 hypothetical protein DYB26_002199 [Aphanomyces astaci]
MEEESWDIVRDLHFLIASDDQLQDDLAHVCDLLNAVDDDGRSSEDIVDKTTSDESDNSSPTPTQPLHQKHPRQQQQGEVLLTGKRPSKRKAGPVRFETRQKDEILHLQAQVIELKAQLVKSQSKHSLMSTSDSVSAWERAARRELAEKNKSLRENEQLQSAVTEQATFIEHMQNIFAKKPRLATMGGDAMSLDTWQEYKLAAQASLREAAIHAIADRQFTRQQNAFILAGLFERTDVLFHAGPRTLPDGSHVLEYIYHMTLPAPYGVVGNACWQVYNGERPPTMADNAERTTEALDARTVYIKYTETLASGDVNHVNVIHKHYIEPDRHVIVWRAVLEDALRPAMATGNVQNEWGWIVIAPVPEDPTQCRLALLGQVPHDVGSPVKVCPCAGEELMDNITSFVQNLSLGDASSLVLPSLDDQHADADVNFMNRGKRLELALQVSVKDAVATYRAQLATVAGAL